MAIPPFLGWAMPADRRIVDPRIQLSPSRMEIHMTTIKPTDSEIQEVSDKGELPTGLDPVSAEPAVEVVTPAPVPADGPEAPKPPVDITKLKVEKSCSRGLAAW